MDTEMAAAAEAARRRVKRASGLMRDALRDLAALTDGVTAQVIHVNAADQVEAARELIAVGHARHGAVDVVVIARPSGRHTPPRPSGAKENTHGIQTSR